MANVVRKSLVVVLALCALAALWFNAGQSVDDSAALDERSAKVPSVGSSEYHQSWDLQTIDATGDELVRLRNTSVECVSKWLQYYCYNRGSHMCRWSNNSCGFSGSRVNTSTVLRGKTLFFRGDSTLRELFSLLTTTYFQSTSDEVTKKDTNRTHRALVERHDKTSDIHAYFHFDTHYSHFREPPLGLRKDTGVTFAERNNETVKEATNKPAIEHVTTVFPPLEGNRTVDVAIMSVGIYESMGYALEDTGKDEVLDDVKASQKDIVGSLIDGVCNGLKAKVGIFYAPTLECRALRKSKGARRKGGAQCSEASKTLRRINDYVSEELQRRRSMIYGFGKNKECEVIFIPAFLCYGKHWVCTNDGMHGRRTSKYLSTKVHLLLQAMQLLRRHSFF